MERVAAGWGVQLARPFLAETFRARFVESYVEIHLSCSPGRSLTSFRLRSGVSASSPAIVAVFQDRAAWSWRVIQSLLTW